ncbi:MAG: hypothetical protein WKF35_01325 [Ferruginibacter sp.]
MKLQLTYLSVFFLLITTMTSCEAIGGIFKAGMWTSVIIIVAIVALVLYFVNRGRK